MDSFLGLDNTSTDLSDWSKVSKLLLEMQATEKQSCILKFFFTGQKLLLCMQKLVEIKEKQDDVSSETTQEFIGMKSLIAISLCGTAKSSRQNILLKMW